MKKISFYAKFIAAIGILFLSGLTYIYADTLTPSVYEISMNSDSTEDGTLKYTNDTSDTVVITPVVSAYNPETEQLISETGSNIFVTIDKETYTVKASESLTLEYKINPADNLTPGTYFNIIILQKSIDEGYTTGKNTTGATSVLSQLVAIHIFDTGDISTGFSISGDFAQITMEMVDPGIPFILPLKVKYTYQNTSNYVLEPAGEIQVFDTKSSQAPIYTNINSSDKKLYPGESTEETVTINKWTISDILFGRKVVGRFYNGIDETYQTKELTVKTYYVYLGILLAVAFLIILLVKAIQKDKKQSS